MKKIKFRHIIFSIIGISAIASIAATIPYALSVQTENFNSQLKIFTKDASSAKSLASTTQFNSAEFDKLVTNLKPKEKFARRLNAYDALNLHFDNVYNFDLNDAVDFSELSKKYPDLLFKLVLPESKSAIEIKQNVLKNLGINVSNATKSINYTAKFDLDFSKQEKSFQFSPENFSASISLSKLKFLEGKTATETAILFNKNFQKNFSETNNETKALYKTFSQFGGVSFSLNSDPLFVLPSNFEIRPEIQTEKLSFNSVNDGQNEIILNLVLLEKLTKKEHKFPLKFLDLPKASQEYGAKFLEIFKKNYEFNSVISKYLAKNNSNVTKLFASSSSLDGLDLGQFSSWFTEKQDGNTKFLEEIKQLIPDFEAKNVSFAVKKPEKTSENKNLINLILKVDGNFENQDQLPVGLKLGENNQYSYNFEFNFDATESLYSGYFRNAIETFDAKTAENLDNLNFNIKKNLPVTIFASTIDNTIKHLLNKPLDLKNIVKTAAPLFDLLNFSADKKQIISVTKSQVSTTLFQDSEEPSNGSVQAPSSPTEESATEESPVPPETTPKTDVSKEEDAGNYLKSIFENLSKSNFPENTKAYLSTSFDKDYKLGIQLKTDGIPREKLEIKINNVVKDNKVYNILSSTAKTHLFLDWRANVETESKKESGDKTEKNYVVSLKSSTNSGLKFVPGSRETNVWNKTEIKPYVDKEEGGIYLTDSGLKLQKQDGAKSTELKLQKGRTFVYVFKPTTPISPLTTKYYLFKAGEGDSKGNFSVLIKQYFNHILLSIGQPELFKPGMIGYQVEKPQLRGYGGFLNPEEDEKLKKTYNGEGSVNISVDKSTRQPQIEIKLSPKNKLDQNKDFLNIPKSTIMLVGSFEEGKLKFKFYTTEHENGEKPIFEWDQDVENAEGWDLSKNLVIGTNRQITENKNSPEPKGGITFKTFALFDKPENNDKFNEIIDTFKKEYLNSKSQ